MRTVLRRKAARIDLVVITQCPLQLLSFKPGSFSYDDNSRSQSIQVK